jgi:Family of unknown function (DUF6335)
MAKRAKRRAARRPTAKGSARKRTAARRTAHRAAKGAKRQAGRRQAKASRGAARARKGRTVKTAVARSKVGAAPKRRTARSAPKAPVKVPQLNRVRRTLDDTVPTPPSSLDLDLHGSAARTGRAELNQALQARPGITPALTGGDVDATWEQAYFAGDEAPGGDNPTPDQDVVDDIGKALGVQYEDNEELKSADKVVERDKHRWELDPASAEDYKERK